MIPMATLERARVRQGTGLVSVVAFERVAAMEEAERRRALRNLIRDEYSGDAAETRRMTAERLHAWATIARSDLDGARRLGRSYDAVFEEQPADVAMRRAMAVQSVVSTDSDDEERALLLEIVPGMRRQVVVRISDVVTKPSNASGPNDVAKRQRFRRIFRRT